MQRYFAKNKNNNKFILDTNDYHHIKNVMRMKDDDLIEVVYDNNLYLCKLNNYEVFIENKIEAEIKNNIKVNLIVPVLQEQKMDLILQKSTELGVDMITPVITERSIVKLDEKSKIKKINRWNIICKEASEQSKRLDIPKINNIDKLNNIKKQNGLNIICSTKELNNNIRFFLQKHKTCDKINIVIGPEGGLTDEEEKYLNEIGFVSVTLGSRILRVETVPLFLLSVIDYEFME